MKTIFWTLCGLTALAVAARAEDGCGKDTDCKGERICVQRQCVDPEARPPPPPDEHAPLDASPAPIPGASSPMAPRDATRHRHLGFFIRPDLGVGYLSTKASQGGVDAAVRGAAGTFGLAAGGALTENSILAFHIWDVVVSDPTFKSNGTTVYNTDGKVSLFALGPEYTGYFGENYYFSVSPSLTRVRFEANGQSSDTNVGFGLRGAIGKEWWAGDHWGLGVVAHLSTSFNKDSGSNAPTWSSWSGTIAFTATYN